MLHKEWVEDQLREAGLDYGKSQEGTHGRWSAKVLLDVFSTVLDILDEEELDQRVLTIRSQE